MPIGKKEKYFHFDHVFIHSSHGWDEYIRKLLVPVHSSSMSVRFLYILSKYWLMPLFELSATYLRRTRYPSAALLRLHFVCFRQTGLSLLSTGAFLFLAIPPSLPSFFCRSFLSICPILTWSYFLLGKRCCVLLASGKLLVLWVEIWFTLMDLLVLVIYVFHFKKGHPIFLEVKVSLSYFDRF